jgi:HAD superfamily hydrolase (TIGR01549 family)
VLPLWRIHRHVGMGGDQLVPALAGDDVDEKQGNTIRDARDGIYEELIQETCPFDGARALIDDLKQRGHVVVLASSAPEQELEHYLDLLGHPDVDGWTTDDDVEATKPEPDLVRAALDKAGTREAVMVGDTPWDIEAARKAGLETVTVISGGFSAQELRDAGAVAVYETVAELREHLDEPPFART